MRDTSPDAALARIFSDPVVAAWLTSPSSEDLLLTAYNVKLSLICGIAIPGMPVSIHRMYTPLAKCGKYVVGTAYCHGTPNWSCKVVDTITKLGHGSRAYDRVSRFVLNLENGMEWFECTWMKDGRSIVSEKHVGARGICGYRVYYCEEVYPGDVPRRALSCGAYEYDCYFCTARGAVCECSDSFRYRVFQPLGMRNHSWGDFLQAQGAVGEGHAPLRAKVWRHDGESYLDGWLVTDTVQRTFRTAADQQLLQERYLNELGFFNMPVQVGPFVDALRVGGAIEESSSDERDPRDVARPLLADDDDDKFAGERLLDDVLTASPTVRTCSTRSSNADDSYGGDGDDESLSAARTLPPAPTPPRAKVRHQCEVCGTVFKQKVHMDTHVSSVHEGLRPHDCDQCPRKFATVGNLRRHKRNVHEKLRRHSCADCDMSFGERSDLVRHRNKVHASPALEVMGHASTTVVE